MFRFLIKLAQEPSPEVILLHKCIAILNIVIATFR
jgi:hypothetical protein